MSIHYLLDGYNVIHQMPSVLNLAKLEDQRHQLVRFIEQYQPQGSLNNRVTIVFDGNMDVYGGMTSSTVKIIFSQGETADERIKKIVIQSKNAKNMVIVTDDRDIQYAVRALGAKVSDVRSFLGKVRSSGKRNGSFYPKKNRVPKSEKCISKSEEMKITSEFGKIWLNQKRKNKR